MGKSVKETHNLDGSVRIETTYTYKDALGTKHSTTYVTKQTAEEREEQLKKQATPSIGAIIAILIVFGLFVLATKIILTIY